jgi:hypothetical protein
MSPSAGRGDAVTRGLRRRFDLVRILLSRLLLTAVGALLALAADGCVMPIGPEFQNPQEKLPPDPFKPTFTSVDPPFQKAVGLDGVAPTYFAVEVRDINPTDTISVRWVLNYPTYNKTATKIVKTAAEPADQPASFIISLNCKDVEDYKFADRNLVIIVSDNGFLDENAAGNQELRLSYDASGALIYVVGGWRLTGC